MKSCIRTVVCFLFSGGLLICSLSGDNLTSDIAAAVAAGPEAATRSLQDIPFSSESVWNIGIGTNAKWGSDSDADVQQLRSLKGVVNAGSWGQPIYFGTPADPLVTVRNTDKIYVVPTQRIHIPANAVPAGPPGDGHMAFYDFTQPTMLWSYYKVSFNNGRDVTGGLTAALGVSGISRETASPISSTPAATTTLRSARSQPLIWRRAPSTMLYGWRSGVTRLSRRA